MSKLAVAESDWIEIDEYEASRDAWTATCPVLQHFRKQVLNANLGVPDTLRVMLICGADVVESFIVPNVWRVDHLGVILSKQHGVVALDRKGSDSKAIIFNSDYLYKRRENIIYAAQFVENSISSTKVRLCVKRGFSIHYLVPQPVIPYIVANKLYLDMSKKSSL